MKVRVGKRDQRALLILAAAVAAYFLISRLVIPAYAGLAAAEETALQKEAQLKKYEQVIGRKGRYIQLLDQAKKQSREIEAVLIRADSTALAAVEFQTLVEAAAGRNGLEVSQRNVVASTQSKESVREMTMSLVFGCSPAQLVTFLSEIRLAPKFIKVVSMNISPTQIAHEPPKAGEFSKQVRVNMTIATLIDVPIKLPSATGGTR